MHLPQLRTARTAARALVVPAALAVLALAAPQAAAHTDLDSSSPGTGAALAGPPAKVMLTFSDAMDQKYAKVAVTGPGGASAAEGGPRVTGKTVTLALKSAVPSGRYTVGYRVVSADGHPVSGSYTFTVKDAKDAKERSPGPTARGSVSTPPAPAADKDDEGTSGTTAVVLTGVGAVALTGVVLGVHSARRRRTGHGG
ncbi:copper resistance CopC family protein [Streptomyces sp. NPDC050658]|uniref:copper resistance CopC family protein n=1 Tax=unclassified Streptomyces TaxID=2593676 RepID=UPI003444765F